MSLGNASETITAKSPFTRRKSSLSFCSQPSLQALVRFDSQTVVPQQWPFFVVHSVDQVGAVHAFWHRLDAVERKGVLQQFFQLQFQHLSLRLLRSLLKLAPQLLV